MVGLACMAMACSSKGDSERGPVAKPAPTTPSLATRPTDATTAAKPKPTTATPASRGSAPAAAYACTSAADCENSCSQGAVNLAWYKRTFPGGESCEDGCASKTSGRPRCENKRCVAYNHKGVRTPACTNVAGAIETPGPAHRCAKDSDCRTSCRYGAVSKQWYSYGAQGECKDGCTRKGTQTPKCEQGICVNYYRGKRDPLCTQKSIW